MTMRNCLDHATLARARGNTVPYNFLQIYNFREFRTFKFFEFMGTERFKGSARLKSR